MNIKIDANDMMLTSKELMASSETHIPGFKIQIPMPSEALKVDINLM